jgi:WD40 repeat protein
MTHAARCAECHADIPSDTPDGHCPSCLFALGLTSRAEGDSPETADLAAILARSHAPLGVKFHRLGDYELIEEIARGGMGVVFRARQVSLHRPVALKMILAGQFASPTAVRRFQVEAAAAARLHHPHIVAIYETGECDGHHFYSMELVDGVGLDRCAAEFRLRRSDGPGKADKAVAHERQRRAARLMAAVAHAVEYAHQHGVLHRDLKPGNVVIDRTGAPHLTDFGLAKLTQEDGTQFTVSGAVLGTPNYMAPELASGQAHQATTAADVYSLGAILYELLTGRAPFQAPTAVEVWRRSLQEDAPHPSTLNPCVDSDLATIALRCLEKDPPRRYRSAAAVAEDLERWLAGEPIAARPVGSVEKLWRWCRRQPALAGLSLFAALSLVGGLAGVWSQWRRAEHQAWTTRENLYAADMGLAQQALREGNFGRARLLLDAYRPEPGQPDLRGFEWRLLRHSAQGDHSVAFLGHTNAIRSIAFSPDGKLLATAAGEGAVKLWDLESRRVHRALSGNTGGVHCVTFSPDGRLFATAGQEGLLKLWDTATWQVVTQLEGRPFQVAFAPTGTVVAYSEGGGVNRTTGRVRLWNYATGVRLRTWSDAGSRLAFSSDGRRLITGNQDHLALWDVETGRNLWRDRRAFAALAIAVAPDGTRFAACGFQGEVRVYDLADPERSVLLKGHSGRARGVAFSSRTGYLATANGDQTVRVWNVASWDQTNFASRTLQGHGSGVRSVAFSPNGQFIASGDKDGVVLLWDAKARPPATLLSDVHVSYTNAPPVFSRDSHWMAAPSAVDEIGVWDLSALKRVRTFPGALIPLALSDDHQTLRVMSTNYVLQEWDVAGGELRHAAEFVDPQRAFTAKLSPDQKRLAVGYTDGSFALWEVASRTMLWRHHGHRANVREFAFSPDGRFLATASQDTTAKIWDVTTRKEVAALTGHGDEVWTIALSPDGATAVTGSSDHTIRWWAVPSGRLLAVLAGHKEGVFRAAFSPDGRTLATASDDDTVRLWHLATRREVARLDHGFNVVGVSFTPDGETLVSSSHGKAIHLFRAPGFSALDETERRKLVQE